MPPIESLKTARDRKVGPGVGCAGGSLTMKVPVRRLPVHGYFLKEHFGNG